MRLTFLLPHYDTRVSGGFRIVFEYANRLVDRGHQVTVVMPAPSLKYRSWDRLIRPEALKQIVKRVVSRRDIPWFEFDPRVRIVAPILDGSKILPDADAVVATAWMTADVVAGSSAAKGRKYYLIQHYETWDGPKSAVDATWRLPLRKIVVARWLKDLGVELAPGHEIDYLSNSVDTAIFRPMSTIEVRRARPHVVGMLWHPNPTKGSEEGLRAILAFHERNPSIKAHFFGFMPRPEGLPGWIKYSEKLSGKSLVRYYDGLSVFVHTSVSEGWGLPPAEAMACGVPVIAADNPGVLDYARRENSLLYDRFSSSELESALERDFSDSDAAIERAKVALEDMRSRNWDNAVQHLERILSSGSGDAP